MDSHGTCSYNTKLFASGFHGRVWLFLACDGSSFRLFLSLRWECKREEAASSIFMSQLLKHSQPWCPSVLSFLTLIEIRESSLSFVAFGFPHQGLDSLPPSLAAFCPWEHGVLVYVGFGLQKEALFYSLRKKQVSVTCRGQWGHWGWQSCPVCYSVTGVGWALAAAQGRFSSWKLPKALPLPQAASRPVPDPTGGEGGCFQSINTLPVVSWMPGAVFGAVHPQPPHYPS